MYVCMCGCLYIHDRSKNFYPINIKFGIQVGLVESRVEFEDELCEASKRHFQKTNYMLNSNNFLTTSLVFELFHSDQDPNISIWR